MSHKNKTLLFLTCSLILSLIVPISNLQKVKTEKNRDFFWNTDKIEGYRNFVFYHIFGMSLDPQEVIIGKDGFLFLGNAYSNTISDTVGLSLNSDDKRISPWIKNLKGFQDWSEKRNIKFVFVIAPNKDSIYPEYLPNWIHPSSHNITDAIVNRAKSKEVNILDLRQPLKQEKMVLNQDKEFLYYKKNTHWNNNSVSISYREIIDFLNQKYLTSIQKKELSISDSNKFVTGDLLPLLKIQKRTEEKIYDYKSSELSNVCLGDIDKNSKKKKECKDVQNPNVFINKVPQYTVNQKATNKLKLLWLCDSFCTAQSQIFNETFQEIFKVHYTHFESQELQLFIEEYQPDLIIYQMVERSLLDHSYAFK